MGNVLDFLAGAWIGFVLVLIAVGPVAAIVWLSLVGNLSGFGLAVGWSGVITIYAVAWIFARTGP